QVPGFLAPVDLAALTARLDRLTTEPAPGDERRHHHERTEHGDRLARTERFMHDDAHVGAFLATTLAALVAEAIGEDALVYKEKINFKFPGGAGYAAHQDAPAFPLGTRHVTAMVAIDGSDEGNGGLELVAGRHHGGMLAQDSKGCIDPTIADTLEWRAVPCEAGDVLLFDSFTPHRSGPNRSDRSRRVLYVTYSRASEGDLRSSYYETRSRELRAGRVSLIGHFQGELR
ncbi:MAG: phytanoyl-CoA dioxygenase family protein, partial [Phycisphaerales bacterium]|nr:phytanoyl-CoA dioxygenase family protein [Phycisphaerales bacterium]